MIEQLQDLGATLARLDPRSVLDILIVALVIYGVLVLLRGTTAITLLRGIAILVLGALILSNVFELTMLGWILRNSVVALLVAIPILFQPELRRALERLGRTGRGLMGGATETEEVIRSISQASWDLASRHIGALIVIERETGLQEYTEPSASIDARVSADLLLSVFMSHSPLHDGAIVIRGDRIVSARCVFPLSENLRMGASFGTRHRAALGISERSDAVAIVVSEERGTVSVANDGHIAVQPDIKRLERTLNHLLGEAEAPALLSRFRRAS